MTTLSEMYVGQDVQTFEERRNEVVAIVSSAVDLAGVDRELTDILQRLTQAADESEFDLAFDEIASSIRGTTPDFIDAA
jgi:hypothetical protein